MKTIAQQLKITEFPFIIKDENVNQIYFETSYGYRRIVQTAYQIK